MLILRKHSPIKNNAPMLNYIFTLNDENRWSDESSSNTYNYEISWKYEIPNFSALTGKVKYQAFLKYSILEYIYCKKYGDYNPPIFKIINVVKCKNIEVTISLKKENCDMV